MGTLLNKYSVPAFIIHCFSVYTPQVGRLAEEKEGFYEDLASDIARAAQGDTILALGDWNAKVYHRTD